jgi:hypothetical protein
LDVNSLTVTTVNYAATTLKAHISIREWLDGAQLGFGGKFGAVFEELGVEDVGDLDRCNHQFYEQLEASAIPAVQLSKIQTAIDRTVGNSGGVSSESDTEDPMVQLMLASPAPASDAEPSQLAGGGGGGGGVGGVTGASAVVTVEAEHVKGVYTDVFLTHDWGIDQQGRANHARVSLINKGLQKRGVSTWFDEEKMEGSIIDKMCSGIDDAALVIVFVTERYCSKVNGSNRQDNCKLEFAYAAQRKGAGKMIACTMEDRIRNPQTWAGMLGMVLGGDLFVDMVDDVKLEASLDRLAATIRSTIYALPLPGDVAGVGGAGGANSAARTGAGSGAGSHPYETQTSSMQASVPSTVPRLPSGYIVFDAFIASILNVILERKQPLLDDGIEADDGTTRAAISSAEYGLQHEPQLVECAIFGMGGSGKTVVAAAVCREP